MAQALEGAAHRPGEAARGWGRMVFVTFENATQSYADEMLDNVAKAGPASFSKSIAMAHGGSGLLANCVAPAFIETAMKDGMTDQRARADSVSRAQPVDAFLGEERPF